MRFYGKHEAFRLLCRVTKKWGMHVAWPCVMGQQQIEELFKAAPYLDAEKHLQEICDGEAFLLFDTEEELVMFYDLTVGDDGPTETNNYSGPMRVYAVTYDNRGRCHNENT